MSVCVLVGSSNGLAQTLAARNSEKPQPQLHVRAQALEFDTNTAKRMDAHDTTRYDAFAVSTDRLRAPLSEKARRIISKARAYSNAGNHERAIEELRIALAKDRTAEPYVHSILGFEYLETRQISNATSELRQAIALFPKEALNYTNLAVALYLSGNYEQAEAEVKHALELDPLDQKAQLISRLLSSPAN